MKYAIIIIINLYPLILFGQMDVKKNNINYGIGYYGDIMQFLDPDLEISLVILRIILKYMAKYLMAIQ